MGNKSFFKISLFITSGIFIYVAISYTFSQDAIRPTPIFLRNKSVFVSEDDDDLKHTEDQIIQANILKYHMSLYDCSTNVTSKVTAAVFTDLRRQVKDALSFPKVGSTL